MKIAGKIPWFLRAFDQRKRRVYVNHVDAERNLVQFYYFGFAKPGNVAATVLGRKSELLYQSHREAKFDGSLYTHRHFFWLEVKAKDTASIQIDGETRSIRCRGSNLGRAPTGEAISDGYHWNSFAGSIVGTLTGDRQVRRTAKSLEALNRFSGAWVFMDRDDKGDDNAEHLYRYVRDREPGRKIYYLIRRNVPDWGRLKRDNFNLIEFGSLDHCVALANASVLASSHLTKPMLFPFTKYARSWKMLLRHKTVFLQHGTTLADNSRMFNNKNIDLFVVTTESERDSIAKENSNYILSEKEVALTGFPRHDELLRLPSSSRYVLVMPTWRRTLTGAATGDGLQRSKIQGFRETSFCKNWSEFLNSEKLKLLAEKYSIEVVFAPHPNLIPYLEDLNLPPTVKVYDQFKDGILQQYFASSAVLVTDYSSVAFDVAYLLKPVVYFQFDAATIYRDHLPKGYFDFVRDGFGPVTYNAGDAVAGVERALAGKQDSSYRQRCLQTFTLRDGKCCERIYLRMLDLVGEYGDLSHQIS